jgi:hypothetical protein
MSPPHPQPRRTPCSAKSHRRKRKSCAHKELQSHGVEDGYDYLRQVDEPEEMRRKRLFDAWPKEAARAEGTALLAELGQVDRAIIRERISESLEGSDEFILLGGPPCQAYSVMGRSRNNGNPKYRPSEDKRQRLYVEYLQVLMEESSWLHTVITGTFRMAVNGGRDAC